MNSKFKIQLQNEQNGTYQGLVNDQNKKDLFGAFLWDSGDFYVGEWKDNKINGQGIIFFSSGGYLEGQFTNSVVNSKALLVFPNNDKYIANWKLGNLDGKVTMFFKGIKKQIVAVYENGQFHKVDSIKDNVKEVKAVKEFQQKYDIQKLISKYQAIHTNGVQSSKLHDNQEQITFSKISFQDGGFFIGITQNNIPNGLGLFQYSDLKFDCGFYNNGFLNGNGRKNFPNGDFYEGNFSQGKFEGEGLIYHKLQNAYYLGIFKDNVLVNEQQKGEGYPKEMLNKQKNIMHQNGLNYSGDAVSQDWMKLSIFHNQQFIGNIGKQDQSKNFKLNQNQPNNQFSASAHTTSRTKDTTQKYHQKNLDTVYYLNQKMRTAQNPQQNTKISKENIQQIEKGMHRKNQGSLDLMRISCLDQNFNSLQKTKSEYMSLQTFNDHNLSNFYIQIQQPINQLQANQNQSQQQQQQQQYQSSKDQSLKYQQSGANSEQQIKSEQQEEQEQDQNRQRQLSSKIRKQSPYLSPLSRPNSSQKQNTAILSPQFETKKKNVLNSPQTYNLNKFNKMIGYFQQKNIIKKDLSLNSNNTQEFRAQSPLEKIQQSKSQKLNTINLKKLNQTVKNNQKSSKNNNSNNFNNNNNNNNNLGEQNSISPLITQKSQPSLIILNSPDSKIKANKDFQKIESQKLLSNNISDNIRLEKSPTNQLEEPFDFGSQKDISIEALRTKCDSQGDLLQYDNNRTSYLSQPSLQKPKNSIATVTSQNNKQSQFISIYNSQLSSTPQRQSHKSSNSQNKEKSKQANTQSSKQYIPLQSEEAMQHYYQTRIRKQAPEETTQAKEHSLKSKLQTATSPKNTKQNVSNSNSNIHVNGFIEQKKINQNSKLREMEKKKNILINQNKNKLGQAQLQQKNKLNATQNQLQKPLKGLLSVKSQDNLIKEPICSFSSLQEQQIVVTQPDETQKSQFFKNEQFQTQKDSQLIEGQEQQIKEDQVQIDKKSFEQSYEQEENNENKNYLNQQQNYQKSNLRKSDCQISKSPQKQNENILDTTKLLKKANSTENEFQNNENSQINSNKERGQLQNKGTISDQIKHILQLQKVQNNQKHKFSMKPFLLSGNQNKFNQSQESRKSENQVLSAFNQLSQDIQNQNTMNLQPKSKNKTDEIANKKEDQLSAFQQEISQNKQDRHILTPFHPTKTPQLKEVQSANSYQLKSQANESIRSFNQKISSYMSFQERINAIGQCIYKKEWNATQSFNSIASHSRNNSGIIEKNMYSEDNLSVINAFSANNIISKEDLQQKNEQSQQNQLPKQTSVNQLVANYFQAQNNVTELNPQIIPNKQLEDQKKLSDPINIIESNTNFDGNKMELDKLETSADNKQKHDFIFDGIVQSNYNSLLHEEKAILLQFETAEVQKVNCLSEITQTNQPQQEISVLDDNKQNQILQDEPYNFNNNFGILKTEEGEGDSINKNDQACFQLQGMNESDIFKEQSDKSGNLNELQIDQKLFNEEDLLGINALDEIFSQNSGSMCNFTPPKQDFNKAQNFQQQKSKEIFPFTQKIDQINNKDLDQDLEFNNLFNLQLNLENLDIFSISQESQNMNNQNNLNINIMNNQNTGEIADLSGLSPINMKESNLDDPFQQEQMITEFHFYEDLLLQQRRDAGNSNQSEENTKYNQKYRPVLESIQEIVAEDQYTSPQKKQKYSLRQILNNNDDLDLIVQHIQF